MENIIQLYYYLSGKNTYFFDFFYLKFKINFYNFKKSQVVKINPSLFFN